LLEVALASAFSFIAMLAWRYRKCAAAHLSYAETDLTMKAKALAACDPGISSSHTQLKWRDDPQPDAVPSQLVRTNHVLRFACEEPL